MNPHKQIANRHNKDSAGKYTYRLNLFNYKFHFTIIMRPFVLATH